MFILLMVAIALTLDRNAETGTTGSNLYAALVDSFYLILTPRQQNLWADSGSGSRPSV